jgi:hypothetical protein
MQEERIRHAFYILLANIVICLRALKSNYIDINTNKKYENI